MAAECYICKAESAPRYCCTVCGGLFCEKHGTRSDKRSVCQRCVADDTRVNIVKTKQTITYLSEVRDFLQDKIKEEVEPEKQEELKSLVGEIEAFLTEIKK